MHRQPGPAGRWAAGCRRRERVTRVRRTRLTWHTPVVQAEHDRVTLPFSGVAGETRRAGGCGGARPRLHRA